jgi:sugar phosphate isomerase/epimerase
MLALSTSWQSRASTSVEAMLAALQRLDIAGIELSYRISEARYLQMRPPLNQSGLKVVSVHNFFPIPSIRADAKGSGDLFVLSSPENEERQNAIRYTIKSVENASDLGAAAVVLHCGYVEMHHEMHVIYQYAQSNRLYTKSAQNFIRNKLKERDRLKRVFLEHLLSSLDRVVPAAEKHGVWLGLENRYHYHELPTFEDFSAIFAEFEGAPSQ